MLQRLGLIAERFDPNQLEPPATVHSFVIGSGRDRPTRFSFPQPRTAALRFNNESMDAALAEAVIDSTINHYPTR